MDSGKNLAPRPWLSLREASARLGISPTALRAWADQGRVGSFRTPGGHRRFRVQDLETLAGEGRPPAVASSLGLLAHAALGRARLVLAEGWREGAPWSRPLEQGAREEHQRLGRLVVMTLSEALSGEGEEGWPEQAQNLGRAYAEINCRHRLELGEALRALLFFRDTFVESVIQVTSSSPSLDALTLVRRVHRFVDCMLLAMVDAHLENNSNKTTHSGSREGDRENEGGIGV